jgi:phosphoribosylamine---glycine ligase
VEGRLDQVELDWENRAAACVMLASGGYPGAYTKGIPISGADEAESLGVVVFHAGTDVDEDGSLVTAGGRVLGVMGRGDTVQEALTHAYRGVDVINFEGKQFRQDIGWRALGNKQ